ncbi:hypothetical protein Cabys_1067 [Caldithrix abyssi DSM 13497]|uniref:Uncharacterized protein n=1 Tax=Caldithrix abyssi DSM 13497 TaxID=880073 RepID=A0A1J1C7D1_CALAY|nr:hypothetical protein Cabys_1067 [Caldithrix abyssi DSM 13497]
MRLQLVSRPALTRRKGCKHQKNRPLRRGLRNGIKMFILQKDTHRVAKGHIIQAWL